MATLLLSVMGAFAEFERSLILERQRESIAAAPASRPGSCASASPPAGARRQSVACWRWWWTQRPAWSPREGQRPDGITLISAPTTIPLIPTPTS
jgi:hypothetical protein